MNVEVRNVTNQQQTKNPSPRVASSSPFCKPHAVFCYGCSWRGLPSTSFSLRSGGALKWSGLVESPRNPSDYRQLRPNKLRLHNTVFLGLHVLTSNSNLSLLIEARGSASQDCSTLRMILALGLIYICHSNSLCFYWTIARCRPAKNFLIKFRQLSSQARCNK